MKRYVVALAVLAPGELASQASVPVPAALTWTPPAAPLAVARLHMPAGPATLRFAAPRASEPGRARRVLRATVLGAVAGGALGAWAGYALEHNQGYLTDGGARRRRYMLRGGAGGAVVGGYIGAVVGFAREPRRAATAQP